MRELSRAIVDLNFRIQIRKRLKSIAVEYDHTEECDSAWVLESSVVTLAAYTMPSYTLCCLEASQTTIWGPSRVLAVDHRSFICV